MQKSYDVELITNKLECQADCARILHNMWRKMFAEEPELTAELAEAYRKLSSRISKMQQKLGGLSPELLKQSKDDLAALETLEREEAERLQALETELLDAYKRRRASKFEQLSQSFSAKESRIFVAMEMAAVQLMSDLYKSYETQLNKWRSRLPSPPPGLLDVAEIAQTERSMAIDNVTSRLNQVNITQADIGTMLQVLLNDDSSSISKDELKSSVQELERLAREARPRQTESSRDQEVDGG